MTASSPGPLLAAHRAETAAHLAELTAEFGRLTAATVDGNLDDEHDPEGMTIGFERAQLTALIDRAREHLSELDAATQRWEAGRYGNCERCGNPIGDERLLALPAARLCIRCAAQAARR